MTRRRKTGHRLARAFSLAVPYVRKRLLQLLLLGIFFRWQLLQGVGWRVKIEESDGPKASPEASLCPRRPACLSEFRRSFARCGHSSLRVLVLQQREFTDTPRLYAPHVHINVLYLSPPFLLTQSHNVTCYGVRLGRQMFLCFPVSDQRQ